MRVLEWVDLPGPRLFFDRVLDALRSGRHAIVVLPQAPTVDVLSPLVERCGDGESVSVWSDEAEEAEPVALLMQRFGLGTPRGGVHSEDIYRLSEAPEAGGHLIFVECRSDGAIRRWGRFANAWARASAARQLYERSPLCLIAHGGLADWRPESPQHHELLAWEEALDEFDVAAYAARLVRAAGTLTWFEERVAASVIAALSGPDHEVAQRLAVLPLDALFAPVPTLNAVARERGWTGGIVRAGTSNGTGPFHQRFGGSIGLHSVALAALGRHDEIEALVWRGQVAVLFPMIEARRRTWLRDYRNLLTVPYKAQLGVVERIEDLEVSHIADQLRLAANTPLAVRTRDHAYRVRDLRNRLAHFETVSADDIHALVLEESFG